MNDRTLHKKRLSLWSISGALIFIVFLVFFLYPMANLLISAFMADGHFSFDGFRKFFNPAYYYSSTILNSLKVSASVTLISLLLGIPFSYFYTFYHIRGKRILFILCLLCTMSAPFIGAYSWIKMLGRNGFITNFLSMLGIEIGSIYGFGGILLVQSLKLFPLVVIYMNGAFSSIDNSLMEASANLGCKGVPRLFKVVLMLTMPTILAAALLVFMRAFADFGTPALIGEGYTTFPVLIYTSFLSETATDYGFASAVSVIAILFTGLVFLIQKYATSRFKFTINAMNPIQPLKPKGLRGALMYAYCYLLIAVALLPQVYIVCMSFMNYNLAGIRKPGWSLANYERASRKLMVRSINNTLLISVAALALIVVIAVLISYLTVRRSSPFHHALDTITMLPYILPGAVIGIALLGAFNYPVFNNGPVRISGTIGIIVIAMAIRRMPFTSRSATAAIMQIPVSTEEAAISLGASDLKTFVKITIPMMSSGILSGAVLSWVSIITEMSASLMLYNNRSITLTVNTYTQIVGGNDGVAAAFATVTTAFTVVCLILYLIITRNQKDGIGL